MEPKGTFGPRLRQERERRQISLASIANNTKINQSLLEALERDDVSRWPSGIFRKAFLRSYASAIGVNADETWKEFSERFPDPHDVPAEPTPAKQAVVASTAIATPMIDAKPSETMPDQIELVFRVSLPRSWVTFAMRLASRVPAMQRRHM